MRCKKHCTDLSSNVGVCASCLRERLFYLVVEKNRNSQTHSISPISLKKTDDSPSLTNNQRHSDRNCHLSLPDRRFFSTPEVAPTAGSYNPCRKKKHSFIRFSLSNLFRSKKRNADSNPRSSVYASNDGESYGGDDNVTSATSSPFWFSNIRSGAGCRNKQPFGFSEASGAGVMRKQYCPNRGMSPVRNSDCGDAEDEFQNGSGGYETRESRKQNPRRTPAHPSVRRGGGGGNISGLSFCLSPLVRVSPCRRHWNQKGVVPMDSGEIRVPVKAHLSNTKSFCANKSRKVADFGRVATNR